MALVSGSYAAALLWADRGYPYSADSHYHFSVGREIAHGALVPDMAHGLPLTVLADMPVDHYWGYHLLLAPFAWIPNAELGMAVATAFLFAAVCVSMYLFLAARGVVHAGIWAIVPMLFSTQDWRFLQLRGGQLTVILLFALAQVAFFEPRTARRRWMLVAIGYAAMLSYNGGVVLLPFHVAGVLALALLSPELRATRLVEPAFTAAGLALGLTLNPYMDMRASPWRFALLHIGEMGRDTASLYDDQEIAEFHGFSARLLLVHPEWALLLAAIVAAVVVTIVRARSTPRIARTDAIVLAGMALAGILLTAQAIRTREYSVPVAFAFLAVLTPRRRSKGEAAIAAALAFDVLVLHGLDTAASPGHLASRQYEGTRDLLVANGEHPVLNIAEADYCMLRWQYDRVVCVQGLSRYFIYPYPELFHDVWELHDRADTSAETPAILRRFYDRGVRLVAVHWMHNHMFRYAETHPAVLELVFRSPINRASIYRIDPRGF
ncbi:MAG TPA: hypothetical protein VK841_01775 [Polyangiaceae bacterium]|nr:hypothetical protein [Polyangiaceae bacterium]